jgi:transposase
MSTFSNVIGIDVSKLTLDAFDFNSQVSIQVENTATGFKKLIQWSRSNGNSLTELLFCFEHTGLYSLQLAIFLKEKGLICAIIPGLEIKLSIGIARGKNDRIDARRIAEYAFLRKDKITPYKIPSKNILLLKNLLSVREKMVKHRTAYKTTKKEMKDFLMGGQSALLLKAQDSIIKNLTVQIQAVEKEIKEVIDSDENLKPLFDLAISVKGVGLIVGATILVYTNGFTAFKNWRKFASYCGIAPFEYQSGTSIKGKKKVSHLANKKLKALLSNAASSSIVHNPEMRIYYQKRIQEGKSKLSTQNIIKNKLVSRIFATVKRGTPYVDTFKFAA